MRKQTFIDLCYMLSVFAIAGMLCLSCQKEVGPQGPAGPQGPQGPPGTSCTVIQTSGGATIDCSDGTMATVTDGTPGQQGEDGTSCTVKQDSKGADVSCTDGTNAQINNGTDATPVSTVQFCKNKSTVYPTSFPEFGMCISNKIYAVYWDNTNAWLAEVPPGTYKSTSTSAPCNFVIKANCVVQN